MDRKRNLLGQTGIPTHLKGWGDTFCRDIVENLTPGLATVIEYETREDLLHDRRTIINAATSKYGKRKVQTGSEDLRLYVWLIPGAESEITLNQGQKVQGVFLQTA